jgi:hypothetical protein
MLEMIRESWSVFIMIGLVLVGLLQIIAKSRTSEVQPGMATKSDQFSMKTVFLSIRSGEALLFFTVLSITACFFLFALGFTQEISALIPI